MELSTVVELMSFWLLLQMLYSADLQETMPAVGAKALNKVNVTDIPRLGCLCGSLIRNGINVTVNIEPDK